MKADSRVIVVSRSHQFGWHHWITGFREIMSVWPLTIVFAWRNIKLKYKQAILGIAWAVVQPLVLTVAFSLFTRRLGDPLGGEVPYRAFTMSTLIGWSFLQTVVTLGSGGPLMDSGLMNRIYFPRGISVLGWSVASVLDLIIMLFLFVAITPLLGISPTWTTIFVIPLSLILLMLGTGVSFFLGAIMVYYRDVRYALPVFMQFWLFASPVAYPLVSIPENWRFLYLVVNPVAGILDGFYRCLVLGVAPDLLPVAISAAEGLLLLVLGYMFFRSLEPNFVDVA